MKMERPVSFSEARDRWFAQHVKRKVPDWLRVLAFSVLYIAAFASITYILLLAVHTMIKTEVQHVCGGIAQVKKDQERLVP